MSYTGDGDDGGTCWECGVPLQKGEKIQYDFVVDDVVSAAVKIIEEHQRPKSS